MFGHVASTVPPCSPRAPPAPARAGVRRAVAGVVVGLVLGATGRPIAAQPPQPAHGPVASGPAAERPLPRPDSAIHRPRELTRDLVGWTALGRVLWSSGYDQVVGSPKTWPRDAESYGRRFATRSGQLAAMELARHGLAAALGRDPAYVRCGCDGFWPRVSHATLGVLTDLDREGRRHPAWPRFVGAAAGAITLGRLQPGQSDARTVSFRAITSVGSSWLGNVTKEFGLYPGGASHRSTP